MFHDYNVTSLMNLMCTSLTGLSVKLCLQALDVNTGLVQLRSADSRTCAVRRTYTAATPRTDVSRLLAQAFQLVLGNWTSAMNSLTGCYKTDLFGS